MIGDYTRNRGICELPASEWLEVQPTGISRLAGKKKKKKKMGE